MRDARRLRFELGHFLRVRLDVLLRFLHLVERGIAGLLQIGLVGRRLFRMNPYHFRADQDRELMFLTSACIRAQVVGKSISGAQPPGCPK